MCDFHRTQIVRDIFPAHSVGTDEYGTVNDNVRAGKGGPLVEYYGQPRRPHHCGRPRWGLGHPRPGRWWFARAHDNVHRSRAAGTDDGRNMRRLHSIRERSTRPATTRNTRVRKSTKRKRGENDLRGGKETGFTRFEEGWKQRWMGKKERAAENVKLGHSSLRRAPAHKPRQERM